MQTGNSLCIRREGPQVNSIPGMLHGQGREGARTPILHAALPNAPLCLDLGRIGLCATQDLMISKLWGYGSTWKLQAN